MDKVEGQLFYIKVSNVDAEEIVFTLIDPSMSRLFTKYLVCDQSYSVRPTAI
ncbi:hypothetical protein [Metallosphaera sedula]|uniref:hypothetical protein n=2 Tax=Sulfolobaceae TaxID=118883 RepID=UPI00130EDC47|nr:hypothetical protein [Metallosphaera sedula]MCY0863081.1 hypothetical protein [Metallosphaera prunae]